MTTLPSDAFASHLEAQLYAQIDQAGLPLPCCGEDQLEICGHKADFAWPDHRVCVEVQGGSWKQGRHNRPRGYADDRMLTNRRQLAGWVCLEFTGDHLNDNAAIPIITAALRDGRRRE